MTLNLEAMSKEQLIAYCYDIEHRLNDMLPAENHVNNLRTSLKLTPSRAKMLALLSNGRLHTREALFSASRGHGDSADTDTKVVDVHICALRKAVVPLGVEIENVHGVGYQLTAGAKIIRAAMNGEEIYA